MVNALVRCYNSSNLVSYACPDHWVMLLDTRGPPSQMQQRIHCELRLPESGAVGTSIIALFPMTELSPRESTT